MHSLTKVLFCLLIILKLVFGYNILVVFPIHIKSHFITFEPLFKALSARKHNVTVISHFPQKEKLPFYHDIILEESPNLLIDAVNLKDFTGARYEKYLEVLHLKSFQDSVCDSFMSSEVIKKIKDLNFDLVIAEFFNTNCILSVFEYIRAPLVGVSSCGILPWFNPLFGNPDNPSYIPNVFLDYSNEMTLIERFENTFVSIFSKLFYNFAMSPIGNNYAKKYLSNVSRNLDDYFLNSSLLLVNTHFSLHGVLPRVPNIIEVGGIHISSVNKLPTVSSYVSIFLIFKCKIQYTFLNTNLFFRNVNIKSTI